jgi:hypothetical protein
VWGRLCKQACCALSLVRAGQVGSESVELMYDAVDRSGEKASLLPGRKAINNAQVQGDNAGE